MAKKNCIKICEIHFPCARFPRKIDFKDPLVTRVAEKWYLGYGSPRGPLPRNPNKDNYESDYKQNSGFRVYLRASNWSIIPTPTTWVRSLLTHRIERRLRTPMLESQKVARYSTDFSSKTREKNFILNSHSPFFPRVSSPRIGRPSPFHCSPCRANYYAPLPTNFLFFSTRHNGKSIYRFGNSDFNRFKRRRLVFLASARPDVSALLPFFRVKTADD